ncbi:hypothetical protein THAOC_05632 [Thalassiosira oceanica]|uniref:Uncharacterized protein n=1 Tax=Thalassiosira oceanica TaxID=159749 RepID=K0T6V7_THAOC|nr:hypothetical protein THAOC_05632 [Thalassiosira oceanica]|eukprot:EJK72799.1 hypothetical protein THAOC_05632 [Thalassiosira oceanica]
MASRPRRQELLSTVRKEGKFGKEFCLSAKRGAHEIGIKVEHGTVMFLKKELAGMGSKYYHGVPMRLNRGKITGSPSSSLTLSRRSRHRLACCDCGFECMWGGEMIDIVKWMGCGGCIQVDLWIVDVGAKSCAGS